MNIRNPRSKFTRKKVDIIFIDLAKVNKERALDMNLSFILQHILNLCFFLKNENQ
jgi:hypothetical protein